MALTNHLKDGKRSLPLVPDVQVIRPNIIAILAQNPGSYTLQATNTYLVGSGKTRILIDSGEGKEEYVELLLKVMKDNGCEKLSHIIITHWHYDHVDGVPSILAAFDNEIKVLKFMPEIDDNFVRSNPYDSFAKEKFIPIIHNQVINTEGASLTVLYTPGHANDHVCLFLEKEQILFSGDNVLGTGTGVFKELSEYLDSLNLMKGLKPNILLTGHGPIVEDGVSKVEEYIEHRMKRVRQVKQILLREKEGKQSEEITKEIYKGYPEHLLIPANENTKRVLEHLLKTSQAKYEDNVWKILQKSQI